MPASVSTKYIGNPEVEAAVRAAIVGFFESYPGDWGVTLIGAAENDVWELTVIAPHGEKKWTYALHGHDNAHSPDAIIQIFRHVTIGYPSRKYLRIGPPVAGAIIGVAEGYISGPSEWVPEITDATADYEPIARATQERLRNQNGLRTELEKVPGDQLMPKWVIFKDEI